MPAHTHSHRYVYHSKKTIDVTIQISFYSQVLLSYNELLKFKVIYIYFAALYLL
jgi:hypothetical protein